jgi:hypothetical protein
MIPSVRSLLLALALHGCCGVLPGDSCPSPGPPAPDSCNSGEAATVATIEIGRDDDLFTPYHDGDTAKIIRGGQGSTMMGVRLRLTGTVPSCLAQSTQYLMPASGMNSDPVKTYPQTDGSFTTKALWIPGGFAPMFDVQVTIGSQMAVVHLVQ